MTQTKVPVLSATFGIDAGNGYTKAKGVFAGGKPFAVDMPSCVAYTAGLANTPKIPTKEYVENLTNQMDAEIVGPGIKPVDEGRMLFGERAIDSGASLTQFNITNHVPKAKDSLSTILIDGVVASSAIKHWFKQHGKLPEELNVVAGLGVAIPIMDYRDYREYYKQKLMAGNHIVTVRNFAKPIIVRIRYSSCVVVAEGVAASIAIQALGPKFLQAALTKARQDGANIDPAYTGQMLANAKNSITIDIGDGDTAIITITNGRVNVEASTDIPKGFGTALDGAVQDLQGTTAAFETRKDLSDFLLDKNNKLMPAQRATYEQAERAVNAHKPILARDIRTAITAVWAKSGLRSNCLYVIGGGSNGLKSVLEPILIQETKVGNNQNIPILWMDAEYSRYLNRNGLYLAAINGVKASLQ